MNRSGLLGCLLLTLVCSPGSAQEPPSTPAPLPSGVPVQTRTYAPGEYLGAASCGGAKCHGKAEPAGERAVYQNERDVWETDPHRLRAMKVLSNELSKQIGSHLKLAAAPAKSPECLVCHAVTKELFGRGEIVDEGSGISCEGCHGPAGGWFIAHSERGSKHETSVAAGLVDLRRIEVRTQTCLRCHQGAPGGEVTHDLIAAGHPELFFELDTYTDGGKMPAHWRPDEDREGRRATHGSRAWLVGQVESLRVALLLLANRGDAGRWPEFAEMTCDDCHHALRDGGWRRERGFIDRPGIPAWNPMRWTVARHVIEAVAPEQSAAIAADVKAVASGVAEIRRPAGETVPAAARAAASLSDIVLRADRFSLTVPVSRSLLKAITHDAGFRRSGDRQSARQIAASVFSLTDVIYRAKQMPAPVEAWVNDLFERSKPDRAFDREGFLRALDAIPAQLK